MADFVERTRARIADEKKQEDAALLESLVNQQAFVKREGIKKEQAPLLWESFRRLVITKCKEINKIIGEDHYRIDDSSLNTLRVTKINPIRNLRLDFDPVLFAIHYQAGSCDGNYLMDVEESSGKVILLNQEKNQIPSISSLDLELTAEALLEDCLAKATA